MLDGNQTNLPLHSAEDLSKFFSDTFEAMTCICEPKSQREMRFMLGAYKTSKNAGMADVTILTKESVTMTWAEIKLHRLVEST